MDSLQRLRVLRQVALDGSLTAAARSLGMSQPSVSQQLALLERELGSPLAERSSRGVELTAAGHVALEHGLRILNAADAVRRDIEALRTGANPMLRVAAFGTACHALVPSVMAAVRRHQPHLGFDLQEQDVDEAIESVRLGGADVAVAFDYAAHPLDLRGLHGTLVLHDQVLLVLRCDHPLAGHDPIDIGELAHVPWISGTGFGCSESLRTVCGAAGFEPQVALHSNRYPTTLALVAEGHGVALVPATALGAPPPSLAIRRLSPAAPDRRIWAISEPAPRPIVAEFCRELGDVVERFRSGR